MSDARWPERPNFPGVGRVFRTRASGPIGCLAMLLLCPVGLVAGAVMLVVSLFRARRRGPSRAFTPFGGFGGFHGGDGTRDAALRRLVGAFAMDESFSAEEARQAGTLAAGGATADDLLTDAIERGWVEVRGERLAVTRRGREESGAAA